MVFINKLHYKDQRYLFPTENSLCCINWAARLLWICARVCVKARKKEIKGEKCAFLLHVGRFQTASGEFVRKAATSMFKSKCIIINAPHPLLSSPISLASPLVVIDARWAFPPPPFWLFSQHEDISITDKEPF